MLLSCAVVAAIYLYARHIDVAASHRVKVKHAKAELERLQWKDNPDLTHGEWVKPVWPKTRSLMGSVPTPYIMDDRCDWEDAGEAIKYWYDMGKEKRNECGMKGHEFVMSDESMMSAEWMCKNFTDHMNKAWEKWTPRKNVHRKFV